MERDESDETTVIVIPDEVETDDAPDVENNTVVIVADSDDDNGMPDNESMPVDYVERIVNLERDVGELREHVFEAQMTADVAEIVADDALANTEALAATDAAIIDATDEAIVESLEDAEVERADDGELEILPADDEPVSAKVHPMFRSFKDWRNG